MQVYPPSVKGDFASSHRPVIRHILPAFALVGTLLATLPTTAQVPPTGRTYVVSDVQTQCSEDGKTWKPVVKAWVLGSWPTLDGAAWIWKSYKVTPEEAFNGSKVVTFRRTFNAASEVPATLLIDADNAYDASLNGVPVGKAGAIVTRGAANGLEGGIKSYPVTLKPGLNTLLVRAINYESNIGTRDPDGNPAGLIFKIVPRSQIAADLAAGGVAKIYGIHFDTDKATIRPNSKPVLDEIAALLKAQPDLRLEVSGHTDNTGTPAHNQQLSEARAQAVVATLKGKYGIAIGRLTAKGYGDAKPVAPNTSDDGKAKNRRVELKKF